MGQSAISPRHMIPRIPGQKRRNPWIPDWQERGTAAALSASLQFEFRGPGWYPRVDGGSSLIEVEMVPDAGASCWQDQWPPDTVFIYSSFAVDPRALLADMSMAPIR